jgi:hypothetical protein
MKINAHWTQLYVGEILWYKEWVCLFGNVVVIIL